MKEILQQKSAVLWLIVSTCFILLIPLVAMQFSSEVHWTSLDFMVMGILLLFAGFVLILLARKLTVKPFYLSVIAVLLGFLYVWVELATGVFFSFGS
ncbi:hypothetical protein LZP69_09895 [Shewanella sp. AS1]|uniref:hypothetical protein n=1 Tax=Shewanella sp. AS1 TaxID=2907626 RepID=UPI001F297FC6|nr:hypothetical protein [Shewanella sp. AS1]MCE9679472.1 hypothetical protein [Shewanella sp. AS1]